jgi:hypothetical protein
MLFREISDVYCENHTKHTNTLCGQNAEFSMLKRVVYIVITRLYAMKEYVEVEVWLQDSCPRH